MMRFSIAVAGLLLCAKSWSQEQPGTTENKGQLHGNVQALFQNYNPDEAIGAEVPDAKAAMNTFGNFTYTYGQFTAGVRFESYQNAILGFPNRFKGSGILVPAYAPPAHCEHPAIPASALYVPGAHAVQFSPACVNPAVQMQLSRAELPSAECEPAWHATRPSGQ